MKYDWCITHRIQKKIICDIFAEKDTFTVMTRLMDQQFKSVYDKVSEYTKKYIDNRYPCGSGGWIHYRVLSNEKLKDIKLLLEEKLK